MKKILNFFRFFVLAFLLSSSILNAQTTVKRVVLQGFWWDYWNNNYPNSWANYLTELAPRLKALGIDAVWIPPSYKNAGTNSVGYAPFDQYDLGDKYQKGSTTTRFGTKDEFLRMVAIFHANGIEVIQDIVLNHSSDAGANNGAGGEDPSAPSNQWKNFRYACYKTPVPHTGGENATEYLAREGRWSKNYPNFHPHSGHNTESGDWEAGYWGPDFCYGYQEDGTGNGYGSSSNATYNPTQTSGYNRNSARDWLTWFKKQTAVDGFRWDAVKHFPHFVVQDLTYNIKYTIPAWARGGESMYNVGEYVDFDRTGLDAYVNNVTNSNSGTDELIGTFDFDLRDALNGVITGGGGANLGAVINEQQTERVHYYASSTTYVHRTAPFVNNHDTFRPQVDANGDYTGTWNTGDELAPHIDPQDGRLSVVYAIAMAVDGNPQIFFEDLFNVGSSSKRYTHRPSNTTDLVMNSDLENLIWCHQNLYFKNGTYKVRWQAADILVIERSAKALIATNDHWTSWQNLTGVQTDFADGTVLKDYSGANGTATKTVYGGGKVDIDIPPCDGSALNGRRGYAVWAPTGISSTYSPSRATATIQEWEMADDLGDSNAQSLGQGGKIPANSTNQRLAGKIFVKTGTNVDFKLYPENSSYDLTLGLYDLQGNLLDQVNGTGNLSKTYTSTQTGWISLKANNTVNTNPAQKCWINVAYTASDALVTSDYLPDNQAAIWTGNISNDPTDTRNWETGTLPDNSMDLVIPTQNKDNSISISTAISCQKMKVGNGISVTINSGGSITASSDLTIDAGATYTIAAGGQVTVSGNLTNAGTLAIESPTDNTATGSLITQGSITNTGTMSMERYFVKDLWHYVSTPASGADAYSQFVGANNDIYDFVEDTHSWNQITSSSTMTAMKGYAVYYTPAGAKSTFTGTFYTGDQSVTVTKGTTVDVDKRGWNLVGNPYPSPIDWDLIMSDTDIENTIYYYDNSIGGDKAVNYRYYNKGGTAPEINSVTLNEGSRYVPPLQGFFVRAAASGSATFNIPNSSRVHQNVNYYKDDIEHHNFLKMSAVTGEYSDETVIRFMDDATAEYDGNYDAFKLFSTTADMPQIFSYSESELKLAINSLPSLQTDMESIDLGFKSGVNGVYTFHILDMNFPDEVHVFLEDKKALLMIEIQEGSEYAFTFSDADDANRFVLHFKRGSSGTEEPSAQAQVHLLYSEGKIIADLSSLPNSPATMSIFDTNGKQIFSKNMQAGSIQETEFTAATGVYFVKVTAGKELIINKIIIGN